MKKLLKVMALLLVLALVGEYIAEAAMARGGRGGGRGGRGGRGGAGRGGRGGRGGGETQQTPKEVLTTALERRFSVEVEDRAADAREDGCLIAVESLYDAIRRKDREAEAQARRGDWCALANPR